MIEPKNARELYAIIGDAVKDGGRKSIETVCELARLRDTEIKFPAMAALAAWGAEGLQRINDIALEQGPSKAVSAAFKVHSTLAATGSLHQPHLFFWDDKALFNDVNDLVRDQDLSSTARARLHDLVSELPARDLLLPLSVSFPQLAIDGDASISELIRAISTKWLHFGPGALAAYRELIKTRPAEEPAFQSFFERYPQILDPMAVQVWSQPDFHGALEPDFLIRRADNSYLIVEIECPSKPIMTRSGQLAAGATHAEKQATDYKNFIMERIGEARTHFPDIRDPDCLAVIGLQSTLTQAQANALVSVNSMRHKLQTVGFDWLADRASSILANLSADEVKVIRRHRMI